MPCMCWYMPEKASHRLIKGCLQQIVDELNFLQKKGGPNALHLEDVIKCLRVLMNPVTLDRTFLNKKDLLEEFPERNEN